MTNPLSKIIHPWFPSTALGLEQGTASMVELERRGGVGSLRRAATMKLPEALIRPSFDEPNIADHSELATALSELASSAGLMRQKRWSVSLPEATTRTLIVTLEAQPGSHSELEEVLRWKMDRSFGVPLDELSISRERLAKDAQGRDRYRVVATRLVLLDEYESLFSALGWRAGLVLPRHLGESQWLTRNGFTDDSLLLSTTNEGFTAVVFRDKQPLIFRSIECNPDERDDELYRLLLFYRDRRATDSSETDQVLARFLLTGTGFSKARASEIVNESIGGDLRPLDAEDLGLRLPSRELDFDTIAAPAGLATLSWK
ncbi:MAG: type IV pilus biogenesis protein PilM [Pyrinomonadaceae bacterium]